MSKPLELTIYPHSPKHLNTNWLTFYVTPEGPMAAGRSGELPAAKHLTEAELCAEFEAARCDAMIQSQTGRCWQPLGYTWPMEPESIHGRAQTLLRFAHNPHYFEVEE